MGKEETSAKEEGQWRRKDPWGWRRPEQGGMQAAVSGISTVCAARQPAFVVKVFVHRRQTLILENCTHLTMYSLVVVGAEKKKKKKKKKKKALKNPAEKEKKKKKKKKKK